VSSDAVQGKPAVVQAVEKVFNRNVAAQRHVRSRAQILCLFGDFELMDPGPVHILLWRPDSPADVPSDPSKFWCGAKTLMRHMVR
jgi:S-adenosyl methyltransferase